MRQRKAIWQKCGATNHLEKLAINDKIRDMAIKYGYPLRKPSGSFSDAVRAALTHQVHRDSNLEPDTVRARATLSPCCARSAAIVDET